MSLTSAAGCGVVGTTAAAGGEPAGGGPGRTIIARGGGTGTVTAGGAIATGTGTGIESGLNRLEFCAQQCFPKARRDEARAAMVSRSPMFTCRK